MTTTNYSWSLPIVGGNQNQWGTMLNNILADIDAKMVSKTDAQTLTNKTLAAPVITGGASISGNVSVTGGSHGNIGVFTGPSRTLNIFEDAGGSGISDLLNYNNIYFSPTTGATTFKTNNAVSATLDASGNLLVKKTALSNTGRGAYIRADNGNGSCICSTGDGTTSAILFLGNEEGAGAQRFVVLGNGNVQNLNNSYGAISDIKLKQDITDATPKLAKLLKVRIVNYKFKSDPDGIKQIGVIAQELEEISPGLIEETPDYEEVTLTREVEKTVPVTVKKEVTTERVQFDVIDGVAVQKIIKETSAIDEPIVDEYPVFDGDGNPVMEVVTSATDAEIDDEGNEVKAASPAVLRQKIHAVPRMETVVEKEEYTERRLTGTTTKSVKYSIFVLMLIKAMQEDVEETRAGFALRDETIAALIARIEALEARA